MIDERHEELASLYVLDLLEDTERAEFETALTRDPELKALVRELNDATSALVHTAPVATLPAALKSRVMASIGRTTPAQPVPDNIIHTSVFRIWNILPWAAAAGFALTAALLGQRFVSSRTEASFLRDQNRLAEITLKDTRQRLEAEQIINRQQIQTLDQQLAGANRQLADTRMQLADSRTQLGDRDRQMTTLTQRIAALTGDSAEITRRLGEAGERIAKLADELRTQGDLANLKITALASMLDNSPQALAVAVWDPMKQEGMFAFDKMPPLGADQKLELWVVESKENAKPVSAGVLQVSADGTTRVRFKPTAPVTAIAAFAISREKNDGAAFHAAPAEVIMLGKSR